MAVVFRDALDGAIDTGGGASEAHRARIEGSEFIAAKVARNR
jgi:hypothetical protein